MNEIASVPILRPIFNMVGVACLLVSMAWVLQASLFTGEGVSAAAVTWIILSAVIAGIGAGFLFAGRYWMRPQL
jgi:hypothetical protein